MKFEEISDSKLLRPGEMILHSPTHTVVVYAALVDETVRAFMNGALMEDELANFKKIVLTKKQHRENVRTSRCKGCGSNKR
jgi:hypothetical protein